MSISTELTRLNTNKEALATAKTAIASAITTKGGTVTSGDGFADFATDIASIPSGGGDPWEKFNELLTDQIEEIYSTTATHILPYMCRENTRLKKVYINNPNFSYGPLRQRAFESCINLLYAIFSRTKAGASDSMAETPNFLVTGCGNLKLFVMDNCGNVWQGSSHTNTPSLKSFFITRTDKVQPVAANAFTNSSIIQTGTFFVPSSLASAYKSGTNWSAWADRIKGFDEADNYFASASYSIGDVAKYNGKIYAWVNETAGNSVPPNLSVTEIGADWYCASEVDV